MNIDLVKFRNSLVRKHHLRKEFARGCKNFDNTVNSEKVIEYAVAIAEAHAYYEIVNALDDAVIE